MWGRAARTTSPSVRSSIRSTPWVEGCWGPMLRIISSVSMSSTRQPYSPAVLRASLLIDVPVGGREVERAHADLLPGHRALGHLLRRLDVHAVVEVRIHPVLAQGMADPVVGQEHPPQVAVAVEDEPEEVVGLALVPVRHRPRAPYGGQLPLFPPRVHPQHGAGAL